MTEFQASLLIIAVIVVAAVYAHGWWQQWRYRRSLGRVEAAPHAATEPTMPADILPLEAERGRDHFIADGTPDTCSPLDEQIDYIASMTPKFPSSAQVLERVWQHRFDFGKTLRACGCNAASGIWERVIPESPATYSELRVGLQLVDRDGVISATRLADFRELMGEIGRKEDADMVLPLVDSAMERARELDAFCAEVDQIIGLNLVCGGDRAPFASEVAALVQPMGMSLQADGAFHLFAPGGATLFTLIVTDGTPFQHHTLERMQVSNLTLLLDIPRVSEPARHFDEMSLLAMELTATLHATLVDDQRVLLGKGALEQIRVRVATVEQRMVRGGIAPGSAQALRLFP